MGMTAILTGKRDAMTLAAKFVINRTDVDFCHQGRDTDMTIHWKALGVHFLVVPLDFRFSQFLSP
jgi:hypothetical protein